MLTKVLASLVVVAALGIGGYTFYAGTGGGCGSCPFSSQSASTDCCAAQASCCDTATSCCLDNKVASASVPDCCFPGSECCASDDCCLKSDSKSAAVSAVVGVPASLRDLKK